MTEVKGRIVIQQCKSASLKLPVAEGQNSEMVDIGRGMVVFVCFLDGASEDTVELLVKHITSIRLTEEEESGRRVSICETEGDVLLVPQATLGGKMKGRSMQYHNNVDKVVGEGLYRSLCRGVREAVEGVSGGSVKCGVYGARQVLSTTTNGPYTHIIEV